MQQNLPDAAELYLHQFRKKTFVVVNISQEQIAAVRVLQPIERYKHSVKMIADTEEMFSLIDRDGNWELAKIDDRITFFLWPNIDYAQLFTLNSNWAQAVVEKITIQEFKGEIGDFLNTNDYLVNFFSIDNNSGFIVTVDEFMRDLEVELQNYE